MAKFTTTVQIAGLDVKDAFAFLADFSATEQWDPGVERASRNDSGPVGVGSSFEVEAGFLGRTIPLTYRITELTENERVVLHAENANVVSLDELLFSAVPGGAEVTYDAELTGKGAFRVMNPVLQLLFNRIGKAVEAGLKENLEKLVRDEPESGGKS